MDDQTITQLVAKLDALTAKLPPPADISIAEIHFGTKDEMLEAMNLGLKVAAELITELQAKVASGFSPDVEAAIKTERTRTEAVIMGALKASVEVMNTLEKRSKKRWLGDYSIFAWLDNYRMDKAMFGAKLTTKILGCLRDSWGDKEGAAKVARALKAVE